MAMRVMVVVQRAGLSEGEPEALYTDPRSQASAPLYPVGILFVVDADVILRRAQVSEKDIKPQVKTHRFLNSTSLVQKNMYLCIQKVEK